MYLLTFAWMIAVKSHQFTLFQLRDYDKAFVAFLTLHKVHFLSELRTCNAGFVVLNTAFIHMVMAILYEELA